MDGLVEGRFCQRLCL